MSRVPIVVLEKIYKTQAEFEAFVKNLIYNDIGICDDIKNTHPFHYNTLIEILKRHPNYYNKTINMCNLKIVRNALNPNCLGIIIINNDLSETDISWKIAVSGRLKSYKKVLMSAMRSSIDNQIYVFRASNEKKCVLCGNTEKLHVDHIIHFDEIALNYIESKNRIIPNSFGETNDGTYRKCFLEQDSDFKNEWVNYHYKHATLRILCQTCNLKRNKTKHKF
jgi:hypothetical protein